MKFIKRFFVVLVAFFMLATNTSCFAKAFEEEINVVFMYEDEYISHDTVTQFKNIKCPELSEAYIPDGYKFFGWTPYNPDTVKATDENFDQKYISAGGMVHWSDVEEHKENSTVILRALMIDKDEIPKVYHYAVIAWYNKPATSGLNEENMAIVENALKTYEVVNELDSVGAQAEHKQVDLEAKDNLENKAKQIDEKVVELEENELGGLER